MPSVMSVGRLSGILGLGARTNAGRLIRRRRNLYSRRHYGGARSRSSFRSLAYRVVGAYRRRVHGARMQSIRSRASFLQRLRSRR